MLDQIFVNFLVKPGHPTFQTLKSESKRNAYICVKALSGSQQLFTINNNSVSPRYTAMHMLGYAKRLHAYRKGW